MGKKNPFTFAGFYSRSINTHGIRGGRGRSRGGHCGCSWGACGRPPWVPYSRCAPRCCCRPSAAAPLPPLGAACTTRNTLLTQGAKPEGPVQGVPHRRALCAQHFGGLLVTQRRMLSTVTSPCRCIVVAYHPCMISSKVVHHTPPERGRGAEPKLRQHRKPAQGDMPGLLA